MKDDKKGAPPKRCEVCGKKKCLDMNNYDEAKCHADHALVPPDGHPSPPPRPDESKRRAEEIVNRLKNTCLCTTQLNCTFHTINLADEISVALLSYGKEREREMHRKCREAVEEACGLAEKLDGFPFVRGKHMGLREAGQIINALNPDKSSPDAGREVNPER